ncbi:MAG: hypothetical protein SynsKO_33230 [Synoicihabitans sp.]
MDQKMQFVSLAATGRYSVTQLCEDFDNSRKTGHKWLRRWKANCQLSRPAIFLGFFGRFLPNLNLEITMMLEMKKYIGKDSLLMLFMAEDSLRES